MATTLDELFEEFGADFVGLSVFHHCDENFDEFRAASTLGHPMSEEIIARGETPADLREALLRLPRWHRRRIKTHS